MRQKNKNKQKKKEKIARKARESGGKSNIQMTKISKI